MAKAYHFNGGYIQLSNLAQKNHRISNLFLILFRIIIFIVILFGTNYIFSLVLRVKDFYNAISLGAVFATIGSSIISITSLACNNSYEEYQQAKMSLFTFCNDNTSTNMWNFISDSKVLLKDVNHTVAYKMFFPEVVFEFNVSHLSIPIPSNKRDFVIWRLLKDLIKMKTTEQLYFKYLIHNESLENNGIYVWECTSYLLKNAFLYKIFCSFTILGGMVFIAGLIATFIHSYF